MSLQSELEHIVDTEYGRGKAHEVALASWRPKPGPMLAGATGKGSSGFRLGGEFKDLDPETHALIDRYISSISTE